MNSLKMLIVSVREGGFDKFIANFIKLCNITLVANIILCAVSIVMMPVVLFTDYDEYIIYYLATTIVYGAFYLLIFGSVPVIILLLILYLLHKRYRVQNLSMSFTLKMALALLIAIVLYAIVAGVLLSLAWH